MTPSAPDRLVPVVAIPEIRDFERINAELVRYLDTGHGKVRLAGAEGQRLLVAGLAGGWNAVVEVEELRRPGTRGRPRRAGADGRLSRSGRRRRGTWPGAPAGS